ncbi:MAG: universal stress protein [Leptolyngbya sp. BL-A-14]
MFKKILVGVDVYVEAQHAFEDALAIAQKTGAFLHLMHVFSWDAAYDHCLAMLHSQLEHEHSSLEIQIDTDPIVQCMISRFPGYEQAEILKLCLAEAKKSGVRADIETRHGNPARILCDAARSGKADLIAVGHRDQKHWKNRLESGERRLGSISGNVIEHAPCSVLIAHRYIEDHVAMGALSGMQQILVSVDESSTSQIVVKEALDLAKAVSASVTLLHVRSPLEGDSLSETLESYANKATALDVPLIVKQLDIESRQSIGQVICEFAEDQRSDLVLMGRRKLSKLQELVLGSVSRYVVNHASCAVLIVHPYEDG